ncbi:restriction endonuclease subunit S [Campylobacter insulaenigrae]|uniref:restriction endonuclease subunit S n=1 Tax=Campylobacter insulaenigrae TaxID=260714 RepID=UPI002152EF7D|nr:restriction endonuclease subunit S [Campylobacter insulaenigrae]MCR6578167.1 restriction endonuclease subunit S [Campylobacter insulaenigrae]
MTDKISYLMTKLPQGWEVKTIEEVCKNSSSNLALKDIKDKNGQYPVFGASGIVDYVDFYHKDKECLGIIKDGAGVGRVFILPKNSSVIGTLNYLETFENTNLKYLFYFFHSIDFSKYILGSAIPHIYFRDYKKEIIPLPSLKEQERIVGILDESFANIDESIKILEQDLLNLDELMQSALQKAFNPLKDEAKENYKLPQGWEWKSLGKICESISAGGDKPKDYTENKTISNQIPIYANGVNNNGLIGYTNKAVITKSSLTISARGTIGFVCIRKEPYYPIVRLISAIPNEKILHLEYLYFCLFFFIAKSSGSSIPQLTIPVFKNLQIPLPPLQEQEQIVSYLDELSSNVKNLKQNYQAQIKNLQELKKSLLDKAFQGRL